MQPEEAIKAFGVKHGALTVGIASVAAIEEQAPPGHRPSDFLPGARSVVVAGGHHYTKGAWRSPDPRIKGISRSFPFYRRNLALKIASLIEERYGYYAIFMPGNNDSTNNTPFLSLKLCAELAGLGTRGMNGGIVLNQQFGMLNFVATITTMPLESDGPMAIAQCPAAGCVRMWEREGTTPCLAACPQCLSGEIEDGKIKWMEYDRQLCSTYAQTYSTAAFQQTLVQVLDEPDPAQRRALIGGESFGRVTSSLAHANELVGTCGDCVSICPAAARGYVLKLPVNETAIHPDL